MRRELDEEHSEESHHRVERKNHDRKSSMMKGLREEPTLRWTARGHVRMRKMSKMQSDPEPCSKMMLRTLSPVQSSVSM